jgi:uncharacterized protein YuzE
MLQPLSVTIDPEFDLAYVTYRKLPATERPLPSQRISDDLYLNFNSLGELIGIELLDLSTEVVGEAVALAASHGLALSADALVRN